MDEYGNALIDSGDQGHPDQPIWRSLGIENGELVYLDLFFISKVHITK
jgi:hypothetical protein